MATMTQRQLAQAVRSLGLSFRKVDNEYRINFHGGTEATAYYTDDVEDALLTARAMAPTAEDRLHG